MKAIIVADDHTGIEAAVLIGGHKFEHDAVDGFCFNHQSHDCILNLSAGQRYAIREAKPA